MFIRMDTALSRFSIFYQMEEYRTVINSSNQLVHQESVTMPEDVCRDFLRNVVIFNCKLFPKSVHNT